MWQHISASRRAAGKSAEKYFMKIRIIIVSTLVIACIFASLAYGQVSREKEREIRKLLDATGTTKTMPVMMDQMIAQFRKAFPTVPAQFWDDFRKEVDIDELVTLMLPIYDKHMSLEDLKAANTFFATPAGKRFAEKMPVMSAEGFEVGRKWGEAKGRLVVERLKEKGLLEKTE
jgi:uncharacterized protein